MRTIGERLNSSIPATRALMAARDTEGIAALARRQADAGADLLDINAALFLQEEADVLAWAVRAAQGATGTRVMLDSGNVAALKAALRADRAGNAVVNSVTNVPARLDAIVPMLKEHDADVVALCMGEGAVPPSAAERLILALRVLDELDARGIDPTRVWLDPLVEALASNPHSAAVTLETIRLIRQRLPEAQIVCGLSNVSFGLPCRKAVNAAFLSAAVQAGLDAAIMDVTDETLMQAAAAAWALAGRDASCLEYIRFCRSIK